MTIVISERKDAARRAAATAKAGTLIEALPWLDRFHGATGDDRSKVNLQGKDVTITVDLSAGPHSAIILTTDLTEAYVHENSAYST